jgi:hypothetical protein
MKPGAKGGPAMSEQPRDPRIVAGRIVITKYLDETVEGGVAIEVDYSEDLPMIEAMGLLAFVQLNVQEDYEFILADDEDET